MKWTIIIVAMVAACLLCLGHLFCPPMCSFARANEDLPKLILQANGTAYCRMQYCDFRFPLPSGSEVEIIGKVSGGFDTINGKLALSTPEKQPLDMQTYASLLENQSFKVDHWPNGAIQALSTDQLGGRLVVKPTQDGAIVEFSYFGDY
jgi:hypothetical protein